tara:strand:+ start:592 stop:771 length:180 start_codon:yes stop_codon:yes gene_type:complete
VADIKLELTINETNQVLEGLGELPSKTNAWSLIVKIHQQAQPQLPKPEETKEGEEIKLT